MFNPDAYTLPEFVTLTVLGMFLWVRLVIDDLRSQTTASELENSLERLPEGLQEA